MSKIYAGESGRTFRVNTDFDLSSYTDLSLCFIDPNEREIVKTTSDGVTLGTSAITDSDLGVLQADQYVTYEVEEDLFNVAGRWCVQVLYTDTDVTPNDNLYSNIVRFTVHERC